MRDTSFVVTNTIIIIINVLMCNRENPACLEDMAIRVPIHSEQALAAVQVLCVLLQEGP